MVLFSVQDDTLWDHLDENNNMNKYETIFNKKVGKTCDCWSLKNIILGHNRTAQIFEIILPRSSKYIFYCFQKYKYD